MKTKLAEQSLSIVFGCPIVESKTTSLGAQPESHVPNFPCQGAPQSIAEDVHWPN